MVCLQIKSSNGGGLSLRYFLTNCLLGLLLLLLVRNFNPMLFTKHACTLYPSISLIALSNPTYQETKQLTLLLLPCHTSIRVGILPFSSLTDFTYSFPIHPLNIFFPTPYRRTANQAFPSSWI